MAGWVFLRGLARESGHWGDFPEVFRQALPGTPIHLIDLPGNGEFHGRESPATVGEMAEWCRELLARRGAAPPFRLLALSLGAMVAVEWAARHPAEVAGCVLINTSLRPFSPFHHRLRPAAYLKLLGVLLPGIGIEARERAILELTSRRPGRPGVLAHWTDCRRRRPVSARNALRQLGAAMAYRAPGAKPAAPILVLAGAGDALVDPRCSRRLARHWGTAFAEHPEAGHDLPLDDGPWVAGRVAAWLEHGVI